MFVRRRRVKRSFGEGTAASVPAPHRQKPCGALASRPSEGGLRWLAGRWLAGTLAIGPDSVVQLFLSSHASNRTHERQIAGFCLR